MWDSALYLSHLSLFLFGQSATTDGEACQVFSHTHLECDQVYGFHNRFPGSMSAGHEIQNLVTTDVNEVEDVANSWCTAQYFDIYTRCERGSFPSSTVHSFGHTGLLSLTGLLVLLSSCSSHKDSSRLLTLTRQSIIRLD